MSYKTRLFEYAPQTSLRGQVIDLMVAESRGMVRVDAAGRVIHVSDDIIDLGNYTETGHRRKHPQQARRYFDR